MTGFTWGISWILPERPMRRSVAGTAPVFDADENLRLAMAHLLQIIGEAAGRLSPEFREQHPEVPWKAIVGMRHKVVHDYLNVDYNVVWRTATEELPPLLSLLERLVATHEKS